MSRRRAGIRRSSACRAGAGIRPFIGDYDGIVSLGGSVGITWTGPGKTFGVLPISRTSDRGRPGGGRSGGRDRDELHPRPAHVRRATSTPTSSWRRSTSCGGAGSCRSFVTGTTSPTIYSARRHTRKSARLGGGCCTGGSRKASNCFTPMTRTQWRLSSRSSIRAAGGPSGRLPTTSARPTSRQACLLMPKRSGCTRRRWRSLAACLPGEDRDSQELAVLEAMAAPLNARYGYSSPELQQTLERSISLAESLGERTSTHHWPGRAVGVAVRSGAHRRRIPGG